MAAELGVFGSALFTSVILPFLLVFAVVYAILDKTKILGEKRDVNAIVALVIGMLVIGVPAATGVITSIIPVIAVIIIILLSFMLMLGFIGGTEKEGGLSKSLQLWFGIALIIALAATVLWATGLLNTITQAAWANQMITSVILISVIIAVIAVVVSGGKGGKT